MKNKLALVVAVLLGLIAVWGVHQYLSAQKDKYETTYRSVSVVAAAERMKAGVDIRPNMLGSVSMPEPGVTADHILWSDKERLIGQTINRNVERGDALLASYFRRPVERLQDKLEPGERALTLRVDSISGVAGNIVPGSHVDILGTFGVKKDKQKSEKALGTQPDSNTVVVLADVRILAVDNRTREVQYITQGGSQRRASYGTVTVAVSPDEANVLTYAQDLGTLTLTLRSPADTETGPVPPDVNDVNLPELIRRVRTARQTTLKGRKPVTVDKLDKP